MKEDKKSMKDKGLNLKKKRMLPEEEGENPQGK